MAAVVEEEEGMELAAEAAGAQARAVTTATVVWVAAGRTVAMLAACLAAQKGSAAV